MRKYKINQMQTVDRCLRLQMAFAAGMVFAWKQGVTIGFRGHSTEEYRDFSATTL